MASSILEKLGPGGRELVVTMHATVDAAFPLSYATFLASLSALVWGQAHNGLFLNVPFLAALADYTENSAIILMAMRFTTQPRSLPTLAWLSSWAKWILILLSVGLIVWGSISRR